MVAIKYKIKCLLNTKKGRCHFNIIAELLEILKLNEYLKERMIYQHYFEDFKLLVQTRVSLYFDWIEDLRGHFQFFAKQRGLISICVFYKLRRRL